MPTALLDVSTVLEQQSRANSADPTVLYKDHYVKGHINICNGLHQVPTIHTHTHTDTHAHAHTTHTHTSVHTHTHMHTHIPRPLVISVFTNSSLLKSGPMELW